MRFETARIVVGVVERQPGRAPSSRVMGGLDLLQRGRLAVSGRTLEHRDTKAVILQHPVKDHMPTHRAGVHRRREQLVGTGVFRRYGAGRHR
jgi:hypothetical protein